ncbi:MAG: ROK family protein [Moorellaceae bacterium]
MGFLGIDLGGTLLKGGIVNREGRVLARGEVPTQRTAGVEGVLRQMQELAENLALQARVEPADIEGAGVGVPGSVEVDLGLVRLAPNLHWRNVPLRDQLEKLWNLPVVVDNDAHVAALGELWQGAGRGYRDLLLVTIGTGIGSALILKGEVHRGFLGYGAELGHVKMVEEGPPCRCGGRGCLETLASATAMVRRAREELEHGRASLLRAWPEIGPREIIAAASEGDELSREILAEAGRYLGRALANAVLLVGPEAIVVGGGVAQGGETVLGPIRRALEEALYPWQVKPVPVLSAQLGNSAGFIGAAYLAIRNLSPGSLKED